jgi:hypothetical protein
MRAMRSLVLGLALLSVATPSGAQVSALELDNLRAQQEAAQRRAVDLQNQLMAAEARLRAEQATRDLEFSQRLPRTVPQPPYPDATGARVSAGAAARDAPSIPDDMLAQSNRRVRAAAGERR